MLNQAVLVLPAALLAGAAGILLELSWLRIAAAALPGTLPAAALVVPVFLTGWTIGSTWAGRLSDRRQGDVVAAARWLAMSALAAWLVPRLASLCLPDEGAQGLLARVIAGGLPVVPVAVGLGGALPLLARTRSAAGLVPARATGGVAAAGAVGGALACWRWIPMVAAGLDPVLASAVALAVAALICWLVGIVTSDSTEPAAGTSPEARDPIVAESTPRAVSPLPPLGGVLLGVSCLLAGALLVSGQLSALRLHAQSWGDSMATTAEILGGLHIGMGLGAALLCLRLAWLPPLVLVSCLALLTALSSYAAGSDLVPAGSLLSALLLTVPLGVGAGSLVTAACRAPVREHNRLGSWVGDLAALSTLGGVLGGWVHAQWFIGTEGIGTGGALRFAALAAVGLATVLAFVSLLAVRGRWVGAALVPVCVASLVAVWRTDPLEMPWRSGGDEVGLLAQSEGPYGVVSLVETYTGEQRLKLDDRFGLGGSGAALLELQLGRLAACLHPGAERALLLGLGRGHTLAGLAATTRAKVDCVERNQQILELRLPVPFLPGLGPRAGAPELIHADARAWIAGNRGRYDLVVGDLFFPWIQGAGEVLGEEQFHRVRRSLADGGVYVQWLPLHQLTWPAFGSVARAFLQAFPTARLIIATPLANEPLVALVGGLIGGLPDPAEMDALLEPVPMGGGINNSVDVFDVHLADAWTLTNAFADQSPNSSRWPGSELLTLRRQNDEADIARLNLRLLADLVVPLTTEGLARTPVDRQQRRELGRELISRAEALRGLLLARAGLAELAAMDPLDLDHARRASWAARVDGSLMTAWGAFPGHIGVRQVMLERASALSKSGRWGDAAGLLRAAIDEHADVALAAMLGGVLVQLDRHEDAIVLLRAARVAEPDNVSLLLNLATALVHAAEDTDALAVLGQARDVVGVERLPPLHATALALLEQRNGADVLARSALESMDPEEAWANSLRRLLKMF